MSESPTNWIISSGAMVHVGDEVIAADGSRARITGVDPVNGRPVLTYEAGQLKGFAFSVHPFHIRAKVA